LAPIIQQGTRLAAFDYGKSARWRPVFAHEKVFGSSPCGVGNLGKAYLWQKDIGAGDDLPQGLFDVETATQWQRRNIAQRLSI
jgi:hypothetical protein